MSCQVVPFLCAWRSDLNLTLKTNGLTWSSQIFSFPTCRIYGVHDEAKDKSFELELSWVCDEANHQHGKVIK